MEEHRIEQPPLEYSVDKFKEALNASLEWFVTEHEIRVTDQIALIISVPGCSTQLTFNYKLTHAFMFEFELAVHRAFYEHVEPLLKEYQSTGINMEWFYKRKQPSRKRALENDVDDEMECTYKDKRQCV